MVHRGLTALEHLCARHCANPLLFYLFNLYSYPVSKTRAQKIMSEVAE